MQTDRELLTDAATAAGLNPAGAMWHPRAGFVWVKRADGNRTENAWNPLTEDGDAMRLAVQLNIRFAGEWNGRAMALHGLQEFSEANSSDPCAATRRAIVRAAAAMAKKPDAGAA